MIKIDSVPTGLVWYRGEEMTEYKWVNKLKMWWLAGQRSFEDCWDRLGAA